MFYTPGYPIIRDVGIPTPYFGTDAIGNPFSGTGTFTLQNEFLGRHLADSNPGWRDLKPLPINEYKRRHCSRDTVTVTRVDKKIGNPVFHQTSIAPWAAYNYADPSWDGTIDYSVSQLVLNKLMDRVMAQKVNVAQFVAERRQVVNAVASTASKLAKSIRAIKRGNMKGAAQALGLTRGPKGRIGTGIPEQWLALQYGWLPLVGDLHGGLEEFANMCVQQPPVIRATAKAEGRAGVQRRVYNTAATFAPDSEWVSSDPLTKCKGMLEFKLSSSFGALLGRTGVTNPYELAWELLPYSFIVDWFIPVGSYLSRMNYDQGLVYSRGYLDFKFECRWTNRLTRAKKIVSNGADSYECTYTPHQIGSSIVRDFERTSIIDMPIPQLPKFKDPFSLTHAANALSLFAVSFGRSPNTFKVR
jgi:hypothetical protein